MALGAAHPPGQGVRPWSWASKAEVLCGARFRRGSSLSVDLAKGLGRLGMASRR